MSDTFPVSKPPYDFGKGTFLPFTLGDKFGLRVVAWVTLLSMILMVVIVAVFWNVFKGAGDLISQLAADPEDPTAVMGLMGLYFKAIGLLLPFGLISMLIMASAEASILAKYFHGEDKGFFPLKFDTDMWRVVGARLLVGLFVGVAFFALYIVMIILIVGAAAGGSSGGGGLGALIGIIAFFAILAAVCALIYLSVRLSAVSAVAVRDKAFSLGKGFRVTKGYFWPMFGGFVVVFIAGYIAQNILMYGMMFGFMARPSVMTAMQDLDGVEDPDAVMAILSSMFTPGLLIVFLIVMTLYMIVTMFQRLCMAGPGAHAAQLEQGVIETADNFS